jgi:hypothetical protein
MKLATPIDLKHFESPTKTLRLLLPVFFFVFFLISSFKFNLFVATFLPPVFRDCQRRSFWIVTTRHRGDVDTRRLSFPVAFLVKSNWERESPTSNLRCGQQQQQGARGDGPKIALSIGHCAVSGMMNSQSFCCTREKERRGSGPVSLIQSILHSVFPSMFYV